MSDWKDAARPIELEPGEVMILRRQSNLFSPFLLIPYLGLIPAAIFMDFLFSISPKLPDGGSHFTGFATTFGAFYLIFASLWRSIYFLTSQRLVVYSGLRFSDPIVTAIPLEKPTAQATVHAGLTVRSSTGHSLTLRFLGWKGVGDFANAISRFPIVPSKVKGL